MTYQPQSPTPSRRTFLDRLASTSLATWLLRALFLKLLARLPLPRVEPPPAP